MKPDSKITNEKEHEQALTLMEELLDDYDNQQINIDILAKEIEHWEDNSPAFAEFNRRTKLQEISKRS